MSKSLRRDEVLFLIRNVFQPTPRDSEIAILVDLPDDQRKDSESRRIGREVALDWV